MPSIALKHLAKKAGKSLEAAESDWEKAKKIVRKEYDYSEDDPRFWALATAITKKMMGMKESITFKEFLAERAFDKEPDYHSLDIESAIAILNKNCKDALWMLELNRPFWRGFAKHIKAANSGFATVDTSATERESQNTSNYYTVILDNNPLMKGFPKRSRSFIGSSNYLRADDFRWGGSVYAMIPFDNVPIGYVGKSDMWDTIIRLFGEIQYIKNFNLMFSRMGLEPNIASFRKFSNRLAEGDEKALEAFKNVFTKADTNFKKVSFLDQIFQAYSPEKTGHKTFTTATMPDNLKKKNSEVWVGGKIILMTKAMWDKLVAEHKVQK
jgi:hypothetical protein